MQSRLNLLLLLVFGAATVSAADLSITLKTDKRTYEIGNRIDFIITLTNSSSKAYRVIPDTPQVAAGALEISAVAENRPVKAILGGELNFLPDEIAKGAKLLRPSQSRTRIIEADIVTKLPDYYGPQGHGIFLRMSLSEVLLPGPGRYRFVAKVDSPEATAIDEYVRRFFGPPSLWHGKVRSAPVFLEIKSK